MSFTSMTTFPQDRPVTDERHEALKPYRSSSVVNTASLQNESLYPAASLTAMTGCIMEHRRTIGLLDSDGRPFHPRIERVLTQLVARLRREFPALQDEVTLTEVVEEAGRRIRNREERGGPVEKLHGYAWVTIRSVATSRLRLGATRLVQRTLESEASAARLSATPSKTGTAEDVERQVLLRELLAKLSREERLICLWKQAGFSSQEIAQNQNRSVVSVDTIFSRAKQKIRRALGAVDEGAAGIPTNGAHQGRGCRNQ